MIIGIGTDVCDIRRIEKNLEKYGQRFKDKTFTEDEQTYCDAKANPAWSYAKRFAAKEAVAKALATDTSGALGWTDVSVKNSQSGRPVVIIKGTAEVRLNAITPNRCTPQVHISLADDYPYATAFAVVEAVRDC